MNKPYKKVPYGNGIVGPDRQTVKDAMKDLPEELGWEQLHEKLRPVFIRKRPLPPGVEMPVTKTINPVGPVALGVDIGPAFMYVGTGLLASWGKTLDEAFDVATDNLKTAVAAERYLEMQYETLDGQGFWWYQSDGGLASGLLLLPAELKVRYGPEPRLLVAPMRNLILATSFEADRDLVRWLSAEISTADPNGLALPTFALVDGELSIDVVGLNGPVC